MRSSSLYYNLLGGLAIACGVAYAALSVAMGESISHVNTGLLFVVGGLIVFALDRLSAILHQLDTRRGS
jgi:UDP-N-acetylmuramyl pentapeptide phosphotransferase/UDP-N-acetylglucosamine-1-phosphate transferase